MAAILVVEDHEQTARVMERLLRQAGHRVEVARTCAAARECVRAFSPDVLLSDILLPDGCGAELLSELRERFPQLRAIALTGSVADPTQLLGHGFDRVVSKPTDFVTVETAIRAAAGSDEAPTPE
jgi:CheY-like chemotaxis protein